MSIAHHIHDPSADVTGKIKFMNAQCKNHLSKIHVYQSTDKSGCNMIQI
nr:hypothetical protein Iba_chr14bCG17990 [Ipomoea batatas]